MNIHADKTQKTSSQTTNESVQQRNSGESAFRLVNNRPGAITQRKLQQIADTSPQAKQSVQLQAMADHFTSNQPQILQRKANNTGLPDNLKSGIENISGYSMDHVKVHYNSSKPAQLQALAYAQGSEIHLASGQEKHLPHEAWHVVQQAQGRVKPTLQMKKGVAINDDAGLEREADVMGAMALQSGLTQDSPIQKKADLSSLFSDLAPIQLLKDSEITARFGVNGISKADVIYLKTHRPAYGDTQVADVWGAAPKDGQGRATCPNTGKKITWDGVSDRSGNWDMGHKAGHEYRTLWESLALAQITYAQFLEAYRDPDNYQVEDASANRSHLYEA